MDSIKEWKNVLHRIKFIGIEAREYINTTQHGLYTYSNHYSTYIQKRPYSQVNLDRMALQLAK